MKPSLALFLFSFSYILMAAEYPFFKMGKLSRIESSCMKTQFKKECPTKIDFELFRCLQSNEVYRKLTKSCAELLQFNPQSSATRTPTHTYSMLVCLEDFPKFCKNKSKQCFIKNKDKIRTVCHNIIHERHFSQRALKIQSRNQKRKLQAKKAKKELESICAVKKISKDALNCIFLNKNKFSKKYTETYLYSKKHVVSRHIKTYCEESLLKLCPKLIVKCKKMSPNGKPKTSDCIKYNFKCIDQNLNSFDSWCKDYFESKKTKKLILR